MRAVKTILFSAYLFGMSAWTYAIAQDNLWKIQSADDGTAVASVTIDHPATSGKTIVTLLNVGFNPKDRCHPEIGIALLTGEGYGAPIGKISPPKTQPVIFEVDAKAISTPAPFLVKYDNGIEVEFSANNQILRSLANGSRAAVQIVLGTPKFEFPISGAGEAINAARRECVSRQ